MIMNSSKKQAGLNRELPIVSDGSRQVPLFSSQELFGSHHEIIICHKGEVYRIKITRNDKLIMNK